MSKIVLGLDLGITSIGWALVNVDDTNIQNNKILDSGVRIFTIAEHPKDGKSLALPRREARGARQTTKRKAQKLRAIKRLLLKNNILTQDELDNLFIGNKGQKDVWELRREALYRELNNKELSRIMIHLAKHRGYFSNRKSEDLLVDDDKINKTKNSDDKKEKQGIKTGINKNIAMMQKEDYKTIGELLSNQDRKRNSRGNYDYTVSRSMLKTEIEIIFEKQKEFGSELVNDGLLETYKEIAFEQRPLKSVAHMVGKCPFEEKEDRASKSTYTFELFRALQELKKLRIITFDKERFLSTDEIHQIIHKAKEQTTFGTYKHIRKLFNIDDNAEFKGLRYFDKDGVVVKIHPENSKLIKFEGYHKIKKTIQEVDNLYWDKIESNSNILDSIATVLTIEKNDVETIKKLRQIVEHEKVCEALVSISFSKFGHLSTKAIKEIIPFLEEGLDYDKACDRAKYDFKAIFKGNKTSFLPALTKQENLEMTNPVVKRAIAQMRLVYNAIARKYGSIDAVHVEFTRDIKNSKRERDKIDAGQKEFKRLKGIAKDKAIEVLEKDNPSSQELLKFRLWEQQKHRCIYSNKPIRPTMLSDEKALEIDHILPKSRSLDDSLNNKVLCLAKENQDKGNQTPFEYMGSDENSERWQNFVGKVKMLDKNLEAKKRKLLKINFDKSSEKEFLRRNLSDTAYIARFVKNYIEAHIEFKKSKDKQHVFTRNGMLTSQLRYKWGVGDKNRDNHLHHAEDAIIVAFSTQGMVEKLSDVSKKRELKEFKYKSKEEKSKALSFIPPLEEFYIRVQESLADIFVSHMPRRKIGGSGHSQLPYRAYCHVDKNEELRKIEEDKELKKLKKDEKYRSSMGISKGVLVNGGICTNEDMCRVDVFVQKGTKKYFLIPLYTSDFVKDILPDKAIVANGRPWVKMDENYEFCFSIFKNDILSIKQKNKDEVLGYLVDIHSGTANIKIKEHSNIDNGSFKYTKDKETGKQNSWYLFGVKRGVENFSKYQVDALGNYVEVKNEKRQGTIKEGRLKRKK